MGLIAFEGGPVNVLCGEHRAWEQKQVGDEHANCTMASTVTERTQPPPPPHPYTPGLPDRMKSVEPGGCRTMGRPQGLACSLR